MTVVWRCALREYSEYSQLAVKSISSHYFIPYGGYSAFTDSPNEVLLYENGGIVSRRARQVPSSPYGQSVDRVRR